ncbi:MAG: hypothetical protein Q8M22_15225 [Actinomycetota bacterium]|nr:hypothetical protein [Actinomycetota bacterium]
MTTETSGQRVSRRRIVGIVAAAAVVVVAVVAILALRDTGESTDHGGGWIGPIDGDPQVIYEYHDASVAPEYHRSYTLTVWEGSARLVVHSYGDNIHDVTVPIDDAMWQQTLDDALDYSGTDSVENDGCTGGTADEITVLDGNDEEVVHVFMDHCGSGETVYIRSAVSSVLGLFDLATLTATDA